MNAFLRYSLFSAGGACLFSVAYLGFSLAFGVPRHELALVGRFFAEPVADHEAATTAATTPGPAESKPAPAAVGAPHETVLAAFTLPAPYSTEELASLQQELRAAQNETKERLGRVQSREAELDDWERSLNARLAELRGLQTEIEKSQHELEVRSEEFARADAVRRTQDERSWSEIARFFAEGDPEELAARLVQYGPDEAARILRGLDPARVSELVNALPAEKYRAYLEAYRASSKP
jgi:flagellar motility protein MotE (MotC chaperone)